MKRLRTWLCSIWTIIWKSGLFLILWGLLLVPFIVPFSARLQQAQQAFPLQVRLFFDFVSALTAMVTAWIMARFIDRRSFVSLGFAPEHLARDLLLGLAFGAAWLAASVAILWLGGWLRVHPGMVTISFSALAWAGTALLLNTAAQEVLSRSYLFQTIQSQTSPRTAILVSSLLFMAFHAGAFHGSWLAALNVFAAGVLLGGAYYMTRNLWLPIGIHFMWNFLLGPVFGLSVSGSNSLQSGWQLFTLKGPAVLSGGAFGLEGSVAVTLTTAVGILVLFLSFRAIEERYTIPNRTLFVPARVHRGRIDNPRVEP